jgi:hypothetical protein
MSKWGRKAKRPEGFEYVEPTLEILEQELRDKINEPHEGKRKVESVWPVHQINWQRKSEQQSEKEQHSNYFPESRRRGFFVVVS